MEVINLLLLSFRLIDPRQRRIATRLIQVQDALPQRLLMQHPQALPEEALLFDLAIDLRLLGHPPPQAVIAILASALQLAIDQCLGPHQPVLAVIAKALQLAVSRALLDQVAPRIVAVLLIPPLFDPVVLDLVELPRIEVQPIRRWVVTELFAANQRAGITAAQLPVRFVLVLDLATQLVERTHQFTRRVVLITAVNRVVGMLHQQRGIDPGVVHLRELVGRQVRGKLPSLAPHGVIAKAAGELALGPVHLTV
ncbi:hypothetical protein D3C81_1449300 [compost metagenome]